MNPPPRVLAEKEEFETGMGIVRDVQLPERDSLIHLKLFLQS
jgi:hypothetical protein